MTVEPDGLGLVHAFVSMLITVGYLLVPLMVLPCLRLDRGLKVVGTVAAVTGAFSFASMVLRVEHTPLLVVVDAVHAVTVLWFVIWTWLSLRDDPARNYQ